MSWNALCRFVAAAALLLLPGCNDRADTFLEKVVTEGVTQLIGPGEAPPAPPLPTRAQLDEFPGPLLALSFADVPGTGFITAVDATPDGYVTYQDRTRRSVILRGGLITGLQGFRYDLSAIKTQRDDPVVRQTPVADWPSAVSRSYQFTLQSTADYQISVRCQIVPVARERILVFEQAHDVTRIQETCTNERRSFSNTYWAETDTGFIWRSVQWLGARIRPATLDVVRPHPAARVAN